MKKHFLRALLLLTLCVAALSVSALAEDYVEILEETPLSLASELDLPDNDELYEGYITQLFSSPDGSVNEEALYGVAAGNRLAAGPKSHYQVLKSAFTQIAKGNSSSSEIVISTSTLNHVTRSYSLSSLGYSSMSQAAFNEAASRYRDENVQLPNMYRALLSDCPYSQYWHDKTVGVSTSCSGEYDSATRTVTITEITFYFEVAKKYASNYVTPYYGVTNTTLNTTKTRAATTALDNAKTIINKYAGKSDYQKMVGYANEICALVEYDHYAVENDLFSIDINPWQLIYAFDGDPSTNIVCEGYSKAFQYLCENSTLSDGSVCYSVCGDMDGGGHMWNIVRYNGKYYLVDITNSDGGNYVETDSGLFFAGSSIGSVSSGYRFYLYDYYPIDFHYDARTLDLWGYNGILNLSSSSLPAPPTISKQPAAVTTATGNTAKFTVTANGSNLKYQWQYKSPNGSWANATATGNQTATLSVPATLDRSGNLYRCKVTGNGVTIYSNTAKLTVTASLLPKITVQPKNVTTTVDGKATFSVTATGATSYQWQYRASSNDSWANAGGSGNKTATMTFNPATITRAGYQYRCAVKNASGTTYSKVVYLYIKPSITTQPKSITVSSTEKATFSVAATGRYLTYQWQFKEAGGSTWYNNSCTKATLTINPAEAWRNGYQYRCIVKNGAGSVTSNAATLTVRSVAKPTITTQPKNVTTTADGKATFTVAASGTGLSYQWQFKEAGGSTWYDNTCTSATFTINAPQAWRNGYQYRCVVKNAGGSVTSNAATLTIAERPVITSQPKSVTTTADGTATFTVAASGTGLSYQWQFKEAGGSTWYDNTCTSDTFTINAPQAWRNGYQYRCVVKNNVGTTTSNAAALTIV